MARLALKMLFAQRSHFFVTAGGVAVTIMLIVLLLGVHRGAREGSTRFVSESSAGVWVCQDNSTNILRSNSFLPLSVRESIASVQGVRTVSPLLRVLTSGRFHGETVTIFLIGIDPTSVLAGPPDVSPGGAAVSPGQVVLDRSFALKHNVSVGSAVSIQGRNFRVAGLCSGTNAVLTQFSFCTIDDARDLLAFPGIVTCFLVDLEPGTDARPVAREIRRSIPGTAAFTKAEFVTNTVREMETGVLPVLWTIALLAMGAGTVVVTLLLYGSVLARRQDYALLRAIGMRKTELYALVLWQACIVAGSGALLGLTAAAGMAPFLAGIVPELTLSIRASFAGIVGLAALAIACTAAVSPARVLARLDPEEVFRT